MVSSAQPDQAKQSSTTTLTSARCSAITQYGSGSTLGSLRPAQSRPVGPQRVGRGDRRGDGTGPPSQRLELANTPSAARDRRRRQAMPQLTATLSPTHPAAPYGWILRWRRSTEQLRNGAIGLSRPRRSTRSRNRRLTANTAAAQLVPDSDTFQRRPDRCAGAVHRGPTIVPQLSPGGAAVLIAGTTTNPITPQIAIDVASRRTAPIISTALPHVKCGSSHQSDRCRLTVQLAICRVTAAPTDGR
jgi:hypothetical protein